MQLGAMNNPRQPVVDEVRWIGANGFDYVDLTIEAPGAAPETTDWDAVCGVLRENGLDVICHAAPYFPLENPSPRVRQAALDELRRCVDIAHHLGAGLCTTHFRGWPSFLSEASGYDYYRQALSILVSHGAQHGVKIAMENGSDNRHQLKYFREIFHRVPELRLLFDIGHGNVGTAASVTRDYLFALADRLDHVHISDNGGTGDDHLPFGAPRKGGINLRQELRILRSFRYDGRITVEVFGDRRWLLASADLIRELWDQVA
jgi:sugar phosphate isomerase/epimerase